MRHIKKFESFNNILNNQIIGGNSFNQKINEQFWGRIIGEFVERGLEWLGRNVPKILPKGKPLAKPKVKSPSQKTTGKPQDDWATIKSADQNPFYSGAEKSTKVKDITIKNGKPEDVRMVYDEAERTGSDELRKLALGLSTKSIKYFSNFDEFKSVNTYKQIPNKNIYTEEAQNLLDNLTQKLANIIPSNTTFSSKDVRVIEKSIAYLGTKYERELIVVELPNRKTCIFYKSSGSNVETTGKRKGEWFVIPGFAADGFFLKTKESISITNPRIAKEKGFQNNNYLTQLAQWLEANGAEELNFLYWLNYGK